MSLPSLVIPEYTVKLFSQKQPIKVRPYLVGEEKLLMLAQQGEDPKEIQAAIEQVLRICTFNKIDIGKLPSFDLEYLYLQLRRVSVNNLVQVSYKCNHTPQADGQACGHLVNVDIDLDKIQFELDDEHTNKIWLNDEIGILMTYPTKDVVDAVQSQNGVFGVDLLQKCVSQIFTKAGDTHELKDAEPAEVLAFIDSLSVKQFEKVQQFFDTMPKLSYTVDFHCDKCDYKQKIKLHGLTDFFV